MEILLSLTPVGAGWVRQRHVFQYVPDPPPSAQAVALCSHTSPVDGLMVDDQSKPMCPRCLDIVAERFLEAGGVENIIRALNHNPRIRPPDEQITC